MTDNSTTTSVQLDVAGHHLDVGRLVDEATADAEITIDPDTWRTEHVTVTYMTGTAEEIPMPVATANALYDMLAAGVEGPVEYETDNGYRHVLRTELLAGVSRRAPMATWSLDVALPSADAVYEAELIDPVDAPTGHRPHVTGPGVRFAAVGLASRAPGWMMQIVTKCTDQDIDFRISSVPLHRGLSAT